MFHALEQMLKLNDPNSSSFRFIWTWKEMSHFSLLNWKGSHVYFSLVSLGCFFFSLEQESHPVCGWNLESKNTSSWHDWDKFPGQTWGFGVICVLSRLEMGCLFPICRGRQWQQWKLLILGIWDPLSHFQSIECLLVGGGGSVQTRPPPNGLCLFFPVCLPTEGGKAVWT